MAITRSPPSLDSANDGGRSVEFQSIALADGLRALAILCVVLSHVAELVALPVGVAQCFFGLGFWGVSAFFVLSGFLLGKPYVQAIVGDRKMPKASMYAKRRFLRIWPAYAVVVLISALLENFHHGVHSASTVDIMVHLAMLHGFFASYIFGAGNAPLWTMAVDAQFYVALPIAAFVIEKFLSPLSRLHRVRALLIIIAFAAAASMVLRLIAVAFIPVTTQSPEHIFQFQRGLIGMGFAFSIGGALALFKSELFKISKPFALASISAGIILGLATWNVQNIIAPAYVVYSDTIMDFLGACSVGLLLLGTLSITFFERPEDGALISGVASIAYALYLVHHPILHGAYAIFIEHRRTASTLRVIEFEIVSAVVIIVAALILHRVVERPFLSMKERAHE